jgi:hypothetical protein
MFMISSFTGDYDGFIGACQWDRRMPGSESPESGKIDRQFAKRYDEFPLFYGGRMKKIVLLALVLISVALVLRADVYIKTQIHTDPMTVMGNAQPASDQTTEQWIATDKMATVMGDRVMVMDSARKTAYIINVKEKTYLETPLPLDMAKLVPPEASQMLGMMKVTVTVAPNGKTQKVDKWDCKGYDVGLNMPMMPMKMSVWATTDVPFDWKKFSELAMSAAKMGMIDEQSMKEFQKIEGFQIASETSGDVMGAKLKVTSRVVEIASKPSPAGIYLVPAGFTKVDKLSLQELMGKKM